jgi:nitroreductase
MTGGGVLDETADASRPPTSDVLDVIRQRHSARAPFDPTLAVTSAELDAIVEAAAWAPSAHNMQNFEIVVVDDPARLEAIGALTTRTSADFLRENFAQLSFSEEELRRKGVGVIATMFPPAWRTPGGNFEAVAANLPPAPLSHSLQGAPCLLLVLYDPCRRAPASQGDVLGLISLGCVMQSMWLAAQSFGLGFQVLSVFSSEPVERVMRAMIGFPPHLKIAYACRLGHPLQASAYLRVRRDPSRFVHRNDYHEAAATAP